MRKLTLSEAQNRAAIIIGIFTINNVRFNEANAPVEPVELLRRDQLGNYNISDTTVKNLAEKVENVLNKYNKKGSILERFASIAGKTAVVSNEQKILELKLELLTNIYTARVEEAEAEAKAKEYASIAKEVEKELEDLKQLELTTNAEARQKRIAELEKKLAEFKG